MWRAPTSRVTSQLQALPSKRLFATSKKSCEKQPSLKDPLPEKLKTPIEPPPLPSPPKSKSSFGKLLGTTVTLGLAGTVGYAWYDAQFRKSLEDNVPYCKEAFDTLFAYLPDRDQAFAPTPDPVPLGKKDTSTPLPSGPVLTPPPPAPTPPAPAAKKEDSSKQTAVAKEKEPRASEAAKPARALSKREEAAKEAQRLLKEKEAEIAAENAALEVSLDKLIEHGNSLVRQTLESQAILVQAIKKHTNELRTAMEDTATGADKDEQWRGVTQAFQERQHVQLSTDPLVNSAKETIDKLKQAIEAGRKNPSTKSNQALRTAQENLTQLMTDLNKSISQVAKVESESTVMAKYKDLVTKGRAQFQKELESIMPAVSKGGHKKGTMTEDELNSLIAHAHRRIEQLQKQMAQLMAMEQQRLEEALQHQRVEDERLTDQRVKAEREQLLSHFEIEKSRMEQSIKQEFEQELLRELARQAAAHSDHLREILRVQREELEKSFERDTKIAVLAERETFQKEILSYVSRMKGVEAALDARAEMEKIAKGAQDLWLACIALNGAINFGNEEGSTWEEKLKPLAGEVVAISEAGRQHPFVETILKSIPDEAYARGVWTEDSLKARFDKVRRICRRVAMIDESGGTLFKYFMSYVQSFFVFDSVFAKSPEDTVDPEQLDTFTVLAHAAHFLEKGDLEQALRFMNQLEGEPRRVAEDWVREARLLLETRQAADTLMAFASASGLGTIF